MIRTAFVTNILATALMGALAAHPAYADGALERGDAVVTGFSGAQVVDPTTDDPTDGTFIDVEGAAMRVVPLDAEAPAEGQLLLNPSRLDIKARDVGQVFGIAIDDGLKPDPIATVPNIYLGATSAYGLQLAIPDANDGKPERVTKGHPNAAWMDGQFGPGGGPGSIWKVDGVSRTPTLFATLPGNGGPGIGNLAYDPSSMHLFASDLDSGLIHRIDTAGNLVDTFDHGVTGRTHAGLAPVADDETHADITSPEFNSLDPVTWGFTQPERRVHGLAINGGRLYYAVASGPEVWSVSLSLTGEFGEDARREFEVSGTPGNHPISDIAFDGKGFMYVAQRGDARGSYDYQTFSDTKPSVVFRFGREIPDDPDTPGTWVPIPDEIAIGMEPDHRSTSGGIAVGFGYDEEGGIRAGACGGTVWATGDNLRAGDDDADSPGTVHGIQGSSRTLLRPDNEPPSTAYFVGYDSAFDGAETAGHMGDVEIWQPCEKIAGLDSDFYAPMPDLPPDYYPPGEIPPGGVPPPVGWPSWDFNLRVDKEAHPAACVPGGLGFLCTYGVRVTNTGPDPYIGPVTVEDALPAAPAGATMTFDNQPPWTCLPISPTQHACTYDPAVLWPGTSIDLKVTVDTPAPPPVCSLTNTARLTWPWGIGDNNPGDDFDLAVAGIPAAHCPPVAGELANLKIEKSWWGGIEPVCKDKPGHFSCEFLISVINTGPGTYNGSFEFEEQIPAGTSVEPMSAGFTCTNGAPATCTHDPVVFAANQGTLIGLAVKVPKDMAGDLGCTLTNKVKITKAPGGSDQNTDATDDEAQHNAIIPGTLAQCPDLKLSNLKIKKTNVTDGPCQASGGNWECKFKIEVQNFGKPVQNQVTFFDTLTMKDGEITFDTPANWSCSNFLFPNTYVCGSENPDLKHMEKVAIGATVKIPLAPTQQCQIKNTATIVKPQAETAQNTFGGDDTSSAMAQLQPIFPLNGDPYCLAANMNEPDDDLTSPEGSETNLSIAKTAGASTKTGTGQNTPFSITVTNEGDGVFNGPIVVRETLPVEPSNGSWSAPWVCEGQSAVGHPEQGLCTHPPVTLDPGESVTLDMEMEMPNSYVAPSGSTVKCGYENLVEIVEAPGGSPQNTDAGDDTATAEVTFAPFELHGQTFCGIDDVTIPPPPPPTRCPQGWSKTPVPGKCCPPRSSWDGERCSRDDGESFTCERESCGRHQVWNADDCRCIDRTCPKGTVGNYPDCKPVSVPPEKCVRKDCGRTAAWDSERCACVPKRCPAGMTGTYPNCKPKACPKGTVGTPPNCRKVPKTCGPGFRGTPPNCTKIIVDPPKRCPKGYRGRPPNCKKIPPQTCPKGFRGTPPNCKRIVQPPKTCPKGFRGTPPNCKRIVQPPKRCPKGFRGRPPNCKRIVQPPKKCPKGFRGRPPNCKRIGPVNSIQRLQAPQTRVR